MKKATNASAKVESKAKEVVTVPATIKAAVKAVLETTQGVQVAQRAAEDSRKSCARELMKITKDIDKAKAILKQAFEDANANTPTHLSTRSNIVTYFNGLTKSPDKVKELETMKATPAQQLAVIRGNATIKTDKKTGVKEIVVVKKDNRGGSNKVKPLDALRKSLEDALTLANTAKLLDDSEILVTQVNEILKALECDFEIAESE